ncbi:MAG: aminotransferase class III-fold pyridoxal phosphate-dependent enzyme [Porticoccaceae bacterium]|jgi:putrescine aminotransferase|nr:aminotransferase class III-fold pyridoxal phosphate-dependent enzyme [Porticoccaceae bacterium]|tara:strand:+ start:1724 stop:3166 length:1443 start_codon:yes stop_codon:yes gene_type:complete
MFPLAAYKQQRNSQMSHQKIPNPGIDRPRGSEIWRKDRAHVIHPYTDFATFQDEGSHVISSASGCYVTDIEGNKYLDAIAGLWCTNIGHGRADMAEAIASQVGKMQYYNPFGHTTNEPAAVLAEKIAQLTPGSLNHVYFTCGGSTANDSAIRVIHYYNNLRGKPNKKHVISRNNGYHGSTYIAANLTGIQATKNCFDAVGSDWISHVSAADMYRRPVGAESLSEADYCDFLCNELENHILQLGADNVAAFIAEPIMGAGGVLVAPTGYHAAVASMLKKYDILMVVDEVVTAFGRLGEWFACESVFGFVPDVLVVAKGINSGYIPLGAAIFSSEIYDVISQPQAEGGVFSMGFTYTGHAVACAAALKNIDILDAEDILQNVKKLSPILHQEAEKLLHHDIVGDVRGQGFMLGIELVKDKQTKEPLLGAHKIYELCLSLGVIVRPIGSIVVISPPLTFSAEDINKLMAALDQSIALLSKEQL